MSRRSGKGFGGGAWQKGCGWRAGQTDGLLIVTLLLTPNQRVENSSYFFLVWPAQRHPLAVMHRAMHRLTLLLSAAMNAASLSITRSLPGPGGASAARPRPRAALRMEMQVLPLSALLGYARGLLCRQRAHTVLDRSSNLSSTQTGESRSACAASRAPTARRSPPKLSRRWGRCAARPSDR